MTLYAIVTAYDDHSLTVVDVSTPASPHTIGHLAGAGAENYLDSAAGVFVVGDYAYVASYGDDALSVVDISTPATPAHEGEITGAGAENYLGGARGVHVVGNYVYVVSRTDSSLSIFDISTPATPSLVGSLQGAGADNWLGGAVSVFVVGDYAYVAAFADSSLTIVDISTPATPVTVGHLKSRAGTADATEAYKLHDADAGFTAADVGKIINNLTDATETIVTAFVDSGELTLNANIMANGEIYTIGGDYHLWSARGVFVQGSYAYVASHNSDALSIISIANPASPVFVGKLSGAGSPNYLNGARSIFVRGDYAYVGTEYDDSFVVIDVSDPSTPTLADVLISVNLRGGWDVTVFGDYAYVAAKDADTLNIIDISDPTDISLAGAHIGSGDPKYVGGASSVVITVLPSISVPTVQTDAADDIKQTTATLNGTLTSDGGAAAGDMLCQFEWGRTTAYDNITANQSGFQTNDPFDAALTNLLPDTLYHFRASAINVAGTAYGDDATFTTKGPIENDGGDDNETVVSQGFNSSIRRHFRSDANNSEGGVYTIEIGIGGFGAGITSFISLDSSDQAPTPGPDFYKTRIAAAYAQLVAQMPPQIANQVSLQDFGQQVMDLTRMPPQIFNQVNIVPADLGVSSHGEEMSPTIRDHHKYKLRFPTAFWSTLEKRLVDLENMSPGTPATRDEAVLKTLFDANTILKADADDTPEALTIAEQRIVGRLTGGEIDAITIGIADNNMVQIDGTVANLDYAKFTTAGLLGRTYQELVNDISGVIKATDVEVSELGAATYDDAQDYINFFGDRTLLSGGGITDNGNGTATVAAGTAWAKATDSDAAVGKFFDFSADNSVALTDLLTNYLYLDYNGGTPQIVVSTSIVTHGFKQDHIHIATLFRNGTTLHYHEESTIGIGRVNIVDMRLLEVHDADRASGLVTSDAGSLALSVTAGVIYEGLNRHPTTADGSTWSTWYYDGDLGPAAWVEVTGQSTIDNANYNNVATGLVNLTANRYAVHWVYVDIDGENLFIVYGQGNYKINEAEDALVPALLPDIAVHYGVLIAKIVVQQGQTSLEILYPWTTVFLSSRASDHGSLGGLEDVADHAYALLHNGTRALSGAWDMGSQALTNADINSGTIAGVTIDGDLTWSSAQSGMTIVSPTINGAIATTGLTMPAFTMAGIIATGGYAFDGGAASLIVTTSGAAGGIYVQNTDAGVTGPEHILAHFSASPDDFDRVGTFRYRGYNDAGTPEVVDYGFQICDSADISDGIEAGRLLWYLKEAGADNLVGYFVSSGVLSVDASGVGAAAQVDLHDDKDDVALLNTLRRDKSWDQLCEIGVFERKRDIPGHHPKGMRGGYMMKLQPMIYLMVGAIRQNEGRIRTLEEDNLQLREQLERRLLNGPV